MKVHRLLIAPMALFIAACDDDLKSLEYQAEDLVIEAPFKRENSPIFIKTHRPENPLLDEMVNISASNITLGEAIEYVVPSLSLAADSEVNMQRRLNVKFNNQSLEHYLSYLSDLTDYHIMIEGETLKIDARQEMTWNLSSLSMNVNVIDVGDVDTKEASASDVTTHGNRLWGQTIGHLRSILGDGALVVDNVSLGTVTAIALPSRIRLADSWLSQIINDSNKQIHLQVRILDVSIDEEIGRGIDWDLINRDWSTNFDGDRVLLDEFSFSSGNQGGSVIGEGGLVFSSPLNPFNEFDFSLFLNLLRKQGKVQVMNQPNITVTNGRTAYLTTGDEFSYLSEIETTFTTTGVTNSADTERVAIGVSMQVTPKIIEDNRIVVSVVPVISSLKQFNEFSVGTDLSLTTPDIALQQLATQVIVNNGDTISLGGLIADKVTRAGQGFGESTNPALSTLGNWFKSVGKTLERREVVILITPTIVG